MRVRTQKLSDFVIETDACKNPKLHYEFTYAFCNPDWKFPRLWSPGVQRAHTPYSEHSLAHQVWSADAPEGRQRANEEEEPRGLSLDESLSSDLVRVFALPTWTQRSLGNLTPPLPGPHTHP